MHQSCECEVLQYVDRVRNTPGFSRFTTEVLSSRSRRSLELGGVAPRRGVRAAASGDAPLPRRFRLSNWQQSTIHSICRRQPQPTFAVKQGTDIVRQGLHSGSKIKLVNMGSPYRLWHANI